MCIYEEAFAKTEKTDAILVIDGKKLHVNKMLLSYHSDYFTTLFKDNPQAENEINDVEFVSFATLLSLLQENPFEMTKDSVEELLKLADQFRLPAAKRQIEQFVASAACFTRYERLQMADKYNLEYLMGLIINNQYIYTSSFLDFSVSSNWASLSFDTKEKLANEFFSKANHLNNLIN